MVLKSTDPEYHLIDETGQMSYAKTRDWLADVSGLTAEIPDDGWHDIASAFRQDTLAASSVYAAALRADSPVLDVPDRIDQPSMLRYSSSSSRRSSS
ncbi:hypothetical protein [Nocardia sp. NPDC051570]|uniref:hypothetical protein n=1 Tax=Nocardia sp. NPDC051570 TaxID=3364324 RepID=UPI0037AB2D83